MERTTTSGCLRAGPLLVVVAALLLATARVLRRSAGLLAAVLHRWVRLPVRLADLAGAVLVGLAVVTVLNDVLLQQALSVADRVFREANDQTPDGVEQPQDGARSGSPASLVAWDTPRTGGPQVRRRRPS